MGISGVSGNSFGCGGCYNAGIRGEYRDPIRMRNVYRDYQRAKAIDEAREKAKIENAEILNKKPEERTFKDGLKLAGNLLTTMLPPIPLVDIDPVIY